MKSKPMQDAIAGFWLRTASFVFDLLVINLVIFWPFEKVFSGYFTGSVADALTKAGIGLPGRLVFSLFIISILALLYFTFLEYYVGQTLGQMLMRIKVAAPNGLGFLKVLVRNCFIIPFFPFYILWIAEPLHLIFFKVRFLEKITNTNTVMASARTRYYEEFKLQKVQ